MSVTMQTVRLSTVSLFLFLMLLAARAGHVSESFEGKRNGFKVLTIVNEATFGTTDVWDEGQPPTTVALEAIVKKAKGHLAKASGLQENKLRLDSIALKRFVDTHFWFFVINLVESGSEIDQATPVIIKLDGVPVAFTRIEKEGR